MFFLWLPHKITLRRQQADRRGLGLVGETKGDICIGESRMSLYSPLYSPPLTVKSRDEHSTPITTLNRAIATNTGGDLSMKQLNIFLDKRTGAVDIPMANSRFAIFEEIKKDDDGVWKCFVYKKGEAETVTGLGFDEETVQTFASAAGDTIPGDQEWIQNAQGLVP